MAIRQCVIDAVDFFMLYENHTHHLQIFFKIEQTHPSVFKKRSSSLRIKLPKLSTRFVILSVDSQIKIKATPSSLFGNFKLVLMN